MNPYLIEILLKERRREMLEEASRQRLIKFYNDRHEKRVGKLLLALANLLINIGEKLKHRYAPDERLAEGFCRE